MLCEYCWYEQVVKFTKAWNGIYICNWNVKDKNLKYMSNRIPNYLLVISKIPKSYGRRVDFRSYDKDAARKWSST